MSKEKLEKVLVDEEGKPEMVQISVTTSKMVESFGYCLAALFKFDHSEVESLDEKIDELEPNQWFDPYREFIQTIGYDTMCFTYSPPVVLDTDIEDYTFGEDEGSRLPVGKCVIMGRGQDDLGNQNTKCVLALIGADRKPAVLFDPCPDKKFLYFDNAVYFIKTFLDDDETVSEKN